ncbi:acyl carrier protein [Streptomyces sp. INA 01156]
MATRLASRIRDELGVELPVRSVFEHPTVATLVRQLGSESGVRPRCARSNAPRRFRSPSPSAGCGSSVTSTGPAPRTTSRWR